MFQYISSISSRKITPHFNFLSNLTEKAKKLSDIAIELKAGISQFVLNEGDNVLELSNNVSTSTNGSSNHNGNGQENKLMDLDHKSFNAVIR
jgi:hypothetical protein